MIHLSSSGDFSKTESFLKNFNARKIEAVLRKYGEKGVEALDEETPYDTGMTAASWDYDVEIKNGRYKLWFYNDNIVDDIKIALLLQYDHGTINGGFVEGEDYINPATKPIFEQMVEELWREVATT